jgi:hypothetical protein
VGAYQDYQRDMAPPWLQGPIGAKWLEGRGAVKDQLVALLVEAVRARAVMRSPDDALALIGQERNLSRHPGESTEAYRDRLKGARSFWEMAGTLPGIELAMEQLGYTISIIYVRNIDPTRWSNFIPVVRPGPKRYGAPLWDDDGLWEDSGQLWGTDLTAEEQDRIRYIINLVKPSHTDIDDVIFYAQRGALWGEEGLWENDGLWEEADLISF